MKCYRFQRDYASWQRNYALHKLDTDSRKLPHVLGERPAAWMTEAFFACSADQIHSPWADASHMACGRATPRRQEYDAGHLRQGSEMPEFVKDAQALQLEAAQLRDELETLRHEKAQERDNHAANLAARHAAREAARARLPTQLAAAQRREAEAVGLLAIASAPEEVARVESVGTGDSQQAAQARETLLRAHEEAEVIRRCADQREELAAEASRLTQCCMALQDEVHAAAEGAEAARSEAAMARQLEATARWGRLSDALLVNESIDFMEAAVSTLIADAEIAEAQARAYGHAMADPRSTKLGAEAVAV